MIAVWAVIAGTITAVCLIVVVLIVCLLWVDRLQTDVEKLKGKARAEEEMNTDGQPRDALPYVPPGETLKPWDFDPTLKPYRDVEFDIGGHVLASQIEQARRDAGIRTGVPVSFDAMTGEIRQITAEEADETRRHLERIQSMRDTLNEKGIL